MVGQHLLSSVLLSLLRQFESSRTSPIVPELPAPDLLIKRSCDVRCVRLRFPKFSGCGGQCRWPGGCQPPSGWRDATGRMAARWVGAVHRPAYRRPARPNSAGVTVLIGSEYTRSLDQNDLCDSSAYQLPGPMLSSWHHVLGSLPQRDLDLTQTGMQLM
eukprot:77970-Hanusia_phi.AAC.1